MQAAVWRAFPDAREYWAQGFRDEGSSGFRDIRGRGAGTNDGVGPQAVPRVPWSRISDRRCFVAAGLAGQDGMGIRAFDVSSFPLSAGLLLWRWKLDGGNVGMDAGLPAGRPPLYAGAAPFDADSCAIGGAAGQSGRWGGV